MDKRILKTSIAFTVVGTVNEIVYITLMCLGIVPFFMAPAYSLLIFAMYFAAAWAPVLVACLFRIKLNLSLIIAYQVFAVMGILVGTQWEVYKMSLVYDKIVHFASGILIALFAYNVFACQKKNKLSLALTIVLVFSFTMMVGGMWEICEFAFDSLLGKNSQSWMGFVGHEVLMDTMIDLICDCCGGIVGCASVLLLERSKRRKQAPNMLPALVPAVEAN